MNATNKQVDALRIESVHCARQQCIVAHKHLSPAETPCQPCIDTATRILAAKFVLDGNRSAAVSFATKVDRAIDAYMIEAHRLADAPEGARHFGAMQGALRAAGAEG